MQEHGFESITVAKILKSKRKSADGSWLWCTADDIVYVAVKISINHSELCDAASFHTIL